MTCNNILANNRGFSLIELITVIVLLGILAVSVGGRLIGSDGFAEYSYQIRLIAALRAMQTRAMFDTRPATPDNPSGYCFQINISSSPAAFGPPTLKYADPDGSATCQTTIDFNAPQHLSTTSGEMAEHNVQFVAQSDGASTIDYIGFDNLGRPLTSATNCSMGCTLELRGEQNVAICVAAQGYVYAC